VIMGNGPCNAQRMSHRRTAHEDGAWVREAALAHATKGWKHFPNGDHRSDEHSREEPPSPSGEAALRSPDPSERSE
jgi:hypothetical protein